MWTKKDDLIEPADLRREKRPTEVAQEYEYRIRPAAVETLVNVLLKYGIDLRSSHFDALTDTIVFHSDTLLDLKKLRRDRIVGSYKIYKVMTTKEIVDEA